MYCSSCGISVSPGLSYCSRCGSELQTKERHAPREASQETLVGSLAGVTIVGIGALIGLMAVMKEVVHLNEGLIIAFSFLVFFTVLGVDSVIIWLLLRPYRSSHGLFSKTQLKKLTTNELGESGQPLLPVPAFGVTEHTTNTLDSQKTRRNR